MSNSPPRRPLHVRRSDSETNRTAAVRLVPPEPPQLLGQGSNRENDRDHEQQIHEKENNNDDDIYSRTPLPTHPAHILSPASAIGKGQYFYGKQGSDSAEFHQFPKLPKAHQPSATSIGTSTSSTHNSSQIASSATGSSTKTRPRSKSAKRLVIKRTGKTFSLVPEDESQTNDDSISLSTKTSSSSIPYIDNSFTSCANTESTFTAAPSTPTTEKERPIFANHINKKPTEDFQLVGGLRKVPKTPDLKGKLTALDYLDSPLPPLPEISDGQEPHSHELSTKPSFVSTISTTSENTNYKVYHNPVGSIAESAIASSSSAEPNFEVLEQSSSSEPNYEVLEQSSSNPSSNPSVIRGHKRDDSASTTANSNYQLIEPCTPSSVIHHPQDSSTSTSENPNYQIFVEESTPSSVIHRPQLNRPRSFTSLSEYSNYQIHEPDTPTSVIYRPSHRKQASTSTTGTNYDIHHDRTESIAESNFAPSYSGDSNYHIIQESREATPTSVIHRPRAATTTSSEYEIENYVFHDDLSRSVSLVSSRPNNKYSQESLRIPPLKTKKSSNDNFGYYKSRSRETLKSKSNHSLRSRANSLASLSTIHTQPDARRAIVATGSLINLSSANQKSKPLSSWADLPNSSRFHMNETPHQWSSQLSTVLSESEGGTDRGSQSWSEGRRSSVVPSTPSRSRGSRHLLSSQSMQEDPFTRSRSDSVDPPRAAYTRAGRHLSSSSIPVIGDTDEYGDGITAMQDLRTRPSRTRLSGLFSVASSENLRTNTMRSTTSSRANSLLVSTIPTWARLYYGSGERRYLGAPPGSSGGLSEAPSRSNSFSISSGSPNTENFPNTLYSPRRRPRESYHPHARGASVQESMIDITPAPSAVQAPGKLRTWSIISSVWSPHLRIDRRAARQSIWEPPAVSWSTEGSIFGRRNIQVVLLVMGFIFPIAWMIAAVLPLPKVPTLEMREQGDPENPQSSSTGLNDYAREFGPLDEARYQSAKWWRMLNRCMSVVGLLIIAAVVILAIEGTNKGW